MSTPLRTPDPAPAIEDESSAAATATHGVFAGVLVASAYAALEMLLSGPFTLAFGQVIGPWYTRAVFTYIFVYAVLGAVAGMLVGFGLGHLGWTRHHVIPCLSALLMLAFVANAWCWGWGPGTSPFLGLLPPFALWLLCGLLFPEDRARSFAGSPWPAAIVTLAPISVSRDLMAESGSLVSGAVASGIVAVVVALALLSRSRPSLSRLASWKPQAAVTLAVFLVSFGMLHVSSAHSAAVISHTEASERPSERPNIVLITLDTTRADHLSVYGYPRHTTPHLEAFASAATLYRNAYANGDMTLASHASMFTGLYPTQHGAHFEGDLRAAISAEVPTLAELLSKAGYRNYAAVANTVLLDPMYGFARGFDRYAMPRPLAVVSPRSPYVLRMGVYKITLPWLWTEAMRLFMPADDIAPVGEILIAGADGKPFFLFLNFMESHRPWISSGTFRALFPSYDQTFDEMTLGSLQPDVISGKHAVSADELSKMHAAYDGSIAYLDHVVGELLERLQREPWYDRSLIIVTADHGELFGERNLIDHGNSVDHGLTSIPMIVKFPGQTAPSEVRSPVSQVDIFSTIAAAAGVALPGPRPGVDLATGNLDGRRTIIIESYPSINFIRNNPKMDRMERALVKGRWKMIESNRGRRALYDMVGDPDESVDLSTSRADVAQELEGLLREWVTSAESHRPEKTLPANERDLIPHLQALGYVR
jgi:arylsulfatase A-like enzyme